MNEHLHDDATAIGYHTEMDDGGDGNDMVHHFAENAAIDFLSRLALGRIMGTQLGVVDVLDDRDGDDDMEVNLKHTHLIGIFELPDQKSLKKKTKIDSPLSRYSIPYFLKNLKHLMAIDLST